jgi:hypothetical protein
MSKNVFSAVRTELNLNSVRVWFILYLNEPGKTTKFFEKNNRDRKKLKEKNEKINKKQVQVQDESGLNVDWIHKKKNSEIQEK